METTLDCNFKLKLDNMTQNNSKMEIFYDTDGTKDFVGFSFTYKDKLISLNGKKINEEDMSECFFHLEKQQIGFMIDCLKRIYDNI